MSENEQIIRETLNKVLAQVIGDAADRLSGDNEEYQMVDTPENRDILRAAEEYRYGTGNAAVTGNNGTLFTTLSIVLDYFAHLLEAPAAVSKNDHIQLRCPHCERKYVAKIGNNPLVKDGLTITPVPLPAEIEVEGEQ